MTIFALPSVGDTTVDVDVGQAEYEPLLDELDALAKTRYGMDADGAAGGIRQDGLVDIGVIPDGHFSAILRALDHVRNAGHLGPQLIRVRDAMAADGITYTVREPDGRESTWFSYSGTYERGDRIVGGPAGAATVVDVIERENRPTLLVCA